jgi:protein-disulfide isomerase
MLYPAELRGRVRREAPLVVRPAAPQRQWSHVSGTDLAARAGAPERWRDRSLTALEQKPVKVPPMSPVESNEEDLTRKQRREQARTQRKALEDAEASKAARRTRMTQLGVVVAVVVVAIVVVLIATGSSGTKAPKIETQSAQSQSTVAAVDSVVGGIPQSGNVLGNPNAPVTIAYFGDLQCPVCKQFTLGAFPQVVQKWVRAGKVRIEYRSLETATREPEEFKNQQVAALAAGKQNKMWQFVELFYHQQGEESSGYVTPAYLEGLARQAGLNMSKWMSDRNDATLATQVATDAQEANNVGFTGTPSFLIGTTGGAMKKIETSLTDPTAFNEAIESLLKG